MCEKVLHQKKNGGVSILILTRFPISVCSFVSSVSLAEVSSQFCLCLVGIFGTRLQALPNYSRK